MLLSILLGFLFSLSFASPGLTQETSLTVDIRIDSSRDDAEENLESRRVRTGSSDLELVHDIDAGEKQLVGLRFKNVQIPQGADILEAVVQFRVDEPDAGGGISLLIAGELENDAASFQPTDRNLSNRRQTQATVGWVPPGWDTVRQAGPDQRTPDLSAVIQEIVDRQGWQYGNALALFISGNGGNGTRVADSYDGSAKNAPLLRVTYSVDIGDHAPTHGLKVAFIGDQGISAEAKAVLEMIAAERADMVLHLGDLGYGEGPRVPQQWEDQINAILGPDFPYVSLLGNHDVADWGRYQKKIQERLDRVGITCEGELGVQSNCSYRGLSLLLLAPHQSAGQSPFEPYISPEETAAYIEDQLQADTAIWRICAWHHNQNAMQIGNKRNETGWKPYEACRKAGAIIATAHEHSYSRTKTLVNIEDRIVDPVWPDRNNLLVAPGSTFAFVSGLGGHSLRRQQRCFPKTYPYGCDEWANIYARDQKDQAAASGGGGGALFITFHVNGEPDKAFGEFKTTRRIAGAYEVVDRFSITAEGTQGTTVSFQQWRDGYTGTRDTFLREAAPNVDNGKLGWMRADSSETVGSLTGSAQVVLRFDDIFGEGSGQIPQIPTDAQILSARLELEVLDGGQSLAFHRMLKAWHDSATWNTFQGGIQTNGSEAEPQPDVLSGSVKSSVLSLDVTASIQAWIDDPSTNYGWVLLSNSQDGVGFRSANGNGPPRLTVTYQ